MWMSQIIPENEKMERNAFYAWSASGTALKTLFNDKAKGRNEWKQNARFYAAGKKEMWRIYTNRLFLFDKYYFDK